MLLFVLIIVVCIALGRIFKFDIEPIWSFLDQFPLFLSGIIFVVIYVVSTTFIWFGPKDVLRISAAIIFGGYISTLFVWIAEAINAAILFHLARNLGREYVVEKFKISEERIQKMKQESGWIGTVSVRINPLIPFRMIDLGYGLSGIDFKKYITVVLLASPVRILWLQVIIAGLGESLFEGPSFLIEYLMKHNDILLYSFIYFGAVAVLSVIALGIKWKNRRRESTPGPAPQGSDQG